MNAEELFINVGFTYEYRNRMEEFYGPFFETREEMTRFFVNVFAHDAADAAPRRMVNQIQRLVSLANDIDKIRPQRDPLRLLFIRICLESLGKLMGLKERRKADFWKCFPHCFDKEGEKYILDNFRLMGVEEDADGCCAECCGENNYKLSLDDFFRIVKTVRDDVVHKGDYSEMQFFAHDDDSIWPTSLEAKGKLLPFYAYHSQQPSAIYFFQTELNYDRFTNYFVKACIRFVQRYMSNTMPSPTLSAALPVRVRRAEKKRRVRTAFDPACFRKKTV